MSFTLTRSLTGLEKGYQLLGKRYLSTIPYLTGSPPSQTPGPGSPEWNFILESTEKSQQSPLVFIDFKELIGEQKSNQQIEKIVEVFSKNIETNEKLNKNIEKLILLMDQNKM